MSSAKSFPMPKNTFSCGADVSRTYGEFDVLHQRFRKLESTEQYYSVCHGRQCVPW